MKIEKIVNREFLLESKVAKFILPTLAVSLVCVANFLVFVLVPNEKVMGAVQRIFYFHVGSAMATYVVVFLLFAASVLYLATRKEEFDLIASAAASIAFLFCTIVLLTGCIWGHAAWNTWWRWEPRLVSFLILWILCLSYVLLRGFSKGSAQYAVFAAVLGVLITINIPIVIYSIKFVDQVQQLHPQVVANRGLKDSRYVLGFILSNLAAISLAIWMFWLKLSNLVLSRDVREVVIRKQLLERGKQ